MTTHHPNDEMLMEYAAGTLAEPVAVALASHVALCAACNALIAKLEAVGGAALDDAAPAPLAGDALARTLAALDRPEPVVAQPQYDEATRKLVPAPVRRYLGGNLGALKWRKQGKSVERATLDSGNPAYSMFLLRVKEGQPSAIHTHTGNEFTIVLSGAYTDGSQRFGRGDFQHASPDINHIPIAEAGQACICLVVLDAPIKLTGPIGKYFNRFVPF
ncbi:MAG: ChrR family anti-sigma-E factor [Alphaproteobacteria bacterium]